MTANDLHGLRMSRADKRSCVEWLLDNSKMNQMETAAAAGVTTRSVRRIVADRKEENRTLSATLLGGAVNSGEDGRSDSHGKEPYEEQAPIEPRNGMESDGEVEGATNTEWEDIVENATDDEVVQAALDAIEVGSPIKPPADEPTPPDPGKVKNLANQYRDKLVRAIDDYHELAPNRAERDRLVEVVQGVDLW
jgi:hypothetical protein